MKSSIRSLLKRRSTIIYLFLLCIACLLIIRTLFDWSIYQKEERVIAIHYIEDMNKMDYKSLRMQGMNAAREDLNASLYFHPLHPNSDELMNILNEHPDAIVIGDYVHEELESFIAKAKKQHIPVLLADYATDMNGSAFIGVDHQAAGMMAARYMAPLLNERGNVVLIGYHEEGSSSFLVGKGAEEELSTYSSLEVTTNLSCTKDTELCIETITELLKQDKVDGIIALDARSANGVARLIQQMEIKKDIKVLAFEQSNSLIEYLQAETIDALFVYNAFNLGYLSLQYADEMARGKKVPSKNLLTTSIITKENMFWLQNQKLLFPLKDL